MFSKAEYKPLKHAVELSEIPQDTYEILLKDLTHYFKKRHDNCKNETSDIGKYAALSLEEKTDNLPKKLRSFLKNLEEVNFGSEINNPVIWAACMRFDKLSGREVSTVNVDVIRAKIAKLNASAREKKIDEADKVRNALDADFMSDSLRYLTNVFVDEVAKKTLRS